MFKRKLQLLVILPALVIFVWPGGSDFQIKEAANSSTEAKPVLSEPCEDIQITTARVACKTKYGFTARLDFPQIDLKNVLAGNEYLPQAEAVFTEEQTTIGSKTYRNIDFSLQWAPVTPEFLQIYIHEYMPHWGNRVPYRLLWNTRYEECSVQNCMEWRLINQTGEILPPDVEGLHPDLAADSNFNGVPASFWNVNVIP
jgi:hypothetical protein